ncbi:MAG: class I SAM-dependent methyltransferase [Hyphomonas sp.]
MKRVSFLLGAIALGAVACGPKDAPAEPAEQAETSAPAESEAKVSMIDAALISSLRSDEEKARDQWRHPKETLAFFEVEPNSTVAEIWPGGGWYSNILAPYLAAEGQLIMVGLDPSAVEDPDTRARYEGYVAKTVETYSDPKFGNVKHTAFSHASGPIAEPESVDVVVSFRNVHNWMANGYADKLFVDAAAALKPGGILGIVEHRLPSTQTQDPTGASGYVHEDYVKGLADAAGLEFVAASEINANPADTADHPFGVWTLQPNSRTKGRDGTVVEGFDAEAALAIGESDRMTLKFRKPE